MPSERRVEASLALAAPPPEHGAAQGAFSVVVRRLHAFDRDERPQGGFQFEDVGAGRGRLGLGQGGALLEQGVDLRPEGLDGTLEIWAAEGAVAHAVP